jgi:hypothetical protein
MGQACCKNTLGITMPASGDAALLRADQPRPRPIPNEDAHCFAPTRTKIWELPEQVHCSVVGTCLSTADLRKLLTKLGAVRPGDTDHELHSRAVALASQATPAAKLLHKLLDTTHALAIRQFARADTEDAVRRLWQDSCDRGDIPGPYWALLTHQATSYTMRRDAFGHVHMLSHLVGAANRADIRRLAALEAAKTALEAVVERQQDQLQAALIERDKAAQALQAAPVRIVQGATPDPAASQRLIELEHKLAAETARRENAEQRAATLDQAVERDRQARLAAEAERNALAQDLAAAEAALQMRHPGDTPDLPRMDGQSLLYVGGRPHQVTAMRALSEALGASLQHHDGGVDEQIGLLAGLVNRADFVLFPVDCISHEAALAIKRLCRQAGKPFIPLRSAGQGAFLAALATLQTPARPRVAAA